MKVDKLPLKINMDLYHTTISRGNKYSISNTAVKSPKAKFTNEFKLKDSPKVEFKDLFSSAKKSELKFIKTERASIDLKKPYRHELQNTKYLK
jgi:hypothetical protein